MAFSLKYNSMVGGTGTQRLRTQPLRSDCMHLDQVYCWQNHMNGIWFSRVWAPVCTSTKQGLRWLVPNLTGLAILEECLEYNKCLLYFRHNIYYFVVVYFPLSMMVGLAWLIKFLPYSCGLTTSATTAVWDSTNQVSHTTHWHLSSIMANREKTRVLQKVTERPKSFLNLRVVNPPKWHNAGWQFSQPLLLEKLQSLFVPEISWHVRWFELQERKCSLAENWDIHKSDTRLLHRVQKQSLSNKV